MRKAIYYCCLLFIVACQDAAVPTAEKLGTSKESNSLVEGEAKPKAVNVAAKSMVVSIPTEELMGKFDPQKHPDFVKIDKTYSTKSDLFLREASYEAFIKMYEGAKADGIQLTILSATRNFEYQKGIWERKWAKYASIKSSKERAEKILEYSSMPGTSRHHWGTDIDLNDLNNVSFQNGGRNEKVYGWLLENAATYGFCQPYTEKGAAREYGYNEERWHWSYLPLASEYLIAYRNQVKPTDINGFMGAETAEEVEAIQHYVLGVACQ